MNEHLVEWTFLRESAYLQSCIPSLQLERKICQQFTTKYGRIDFAHKIKNDGFLITELDILYAQQTKNKFKKEIKDFCNINNVLSFSYDLEKVKKLYEIEIGKALLNSGVL